MTRAPFINKDAEWLATLGDTFIEDGDFDTGMRLAQCAQHLQSIDDKYLALVKGDAFGAGVLEGYARAYERSNLPPTERSMPSKMREAIARSTVPVTRIPTGKSAKDEKPTKDIPPELAHLKLEL